MINMSVKNKMLVQDSNVRNKNFFEVALGYTERQAIDEAKRCLNCKNNPCVTGCPVQIDIPAFINEIANRNFERAYKIIIQSNLLPSVCGRVCPQEIQCENKCVRGIKGEPVAIGHLERYVADRHNVLIPSQVYIEKKLNTNGHKIAIIGSGPSGLACAYYLVKKGYEITIFEALHVAGGVLSYGIPEFRLPKSIVQKEIDKLKALGVKIEVNIVVGKSVTIDELMKEEGFESVFIGSGAGLPKFMNIPGENFKGVYSANEFLTRINLMKAYKFNSNTPIHIGKKVVVIGGGNVAMDAARCAKRMGANVNIVYRRTKTELPARKDEIKYAIEEGINFTFLTNPIEIESNENGWVKNIKCQQMKLTEFDKSGRKKPVPIEGAFIDIDADCIIISIGTSPNPLIKFTTMGLNTQNFGGIITDEDGLTSYNSVYAGGDVVTGTATVILAMGAGKKAAIAMDKYIQKKR